MEGSADRDMRAMQHLVAGAWWNANLANTKLKPLGRYLDMLKPKARASTSALEVFREHQARGAPIKIRHFSADGKELN